MLLRTPQCFCAAHTCLCLLNFIKLKRGSHKTEKLASAAFREIKIRIFPVSNFSQKISQTDQHVKTQTLTYQSSPLDMILVSRSIPTFSTRYFFSWSMFSYLSCLTTSSVTASFISLLQDVATFLFTEWASSEASDSKGEQWCTVVLKLWSECGCVKFDPVWPMCSGKNKQRRKTGSYWAETHCNWIYLSLVIICVTLPLCRTG